MSAFDRVLGNYKALTRKIRGPNTNRTVKQLLISIGDNAQRITPRATGKLINSRFRKITPTINGMEGVTGYSARYAAAVHAKPGKLLGTNTPRSPASLGNVWDINAEPKFLTKGADKTIKNSAGNILRRNNSI